MYEIKSVEANVEHPASNLLRCCEYWKSHPKVRKSIHLWQHITRIVRQAQTQELELARQEYSRFMQTMSIEEWQAYEEHFENLERLES
jgi:hypothetical protein